MEQVSIERYIDILRNDTNQWLHIIADTMRAITREVMAHHFESTISDSSPITQRMDKLYYISKSIIKKTIVALKIVD